MSIPSHFLPPPFPAQGLPDTSLPRDGAFVSIVGRVGNSAVVILEARVPREDHDDDNDNDDD